MSLKHNIGLKAIGVFDRLVPKKENQVLFYSKPDYSDNGRALYEEFLRQGLDKKYHAVWLVNGNPEKLKEKYPDVEFYSKSSVKGLIEYCKSTHIYRSHMLFGNVRTKKQKVTLIWHGMGIKGPMDHNYTPNFADYITVSSDFYRYRFSSRFRMPPTHCLTTGLPRNDFMFAGKDRMCLDNLPKVKAHPNCKTVIWMPTYHADESTGDKDGKCYSLGIPVDQKEEISELNENLKKNNIVLLIKLHPHLLGHGAIYEVDYSNIQVFGDSDLPPECSLYHLIGGVDAMLTDYSSVFTDFMLLDRPIAFIYDDFEEYSKKPGFAFENVKILMPGVHIGKTSELYSWLDDIANGIDKGEDERRTLNKFINFHNDNKNSLRVLEKTGLLDGEK